MKLYYGTGTCSLAPRIVAIEAGIGLSDEKVDLATHRTAGGADYMSVNPKGYVPALQLDDGTILTEGGTLVQYLADRAPQSGLAPAAGTLDRYRLQEWLTFIGTEIHKTFSPFLFRADTPDATKRACKETLARRFVGLDQLLAKAPFLMGDRFTAADAYLFTVVGWSNYVGVDLAPYAHLRAFMDRVAARPAVQAAMKAEGMTK